MPLTAAEARGLLDQAQKTPTEDMLVVTKNMRELFDERVKDAIGGLQNRITIGHLNDLRGSSIGFVRHFSKEQIDVIDKLFVREVQDDGYKIEHVEHQGGLGGDIKYWEVTW